MASKRLMDPPRGGLAALAEHFLHKKLDKGPQQGGWGDVTLPPTKIQYAALDAWVLLAIIPFLGSLEEFVPASRRDQPGSTALLTLFLVLSMCCTPSCPPELS